jgi:radical SAM-linked protein
LRYRVAIRLSIGGDLRFISHHDTMRFFERAIARAGLPVKFSEGFNPRPRISLPLPRPVGIASQADVLVIELSEPLDVTAVVSRLSAQVPRDLRLQEAWVLEGPGNLHPRTALYELPLPAELMPGVREKISELTARSEWLVSRTAQRDKRDGQIDLRPFLFDAQVGPDHVSWTVSVMNSGSIRPAEFIAGVGLEPGDWQHRVIRRSVEWSRQPENELSAASIDAET